MYDAGFEYRFEPHQDPPTASSCFFMGLAGMSKTYSRSVVSCFLTLFFMRFAALSHGKMVLHFSAGRTTGDSTWMI
ncbi:hypothetical protein [Agrobacterium larrymoorei]|uniref:hypothetical protein n=1 Tax=Agrobacterium larrymoorei TaxID=160699 RepID=UPI0030BD00AB